MVACHIQAEIENEKLTKLLAEKTAAQEQIMRQEQLAKAAEEKAMMREAEKAKHEANLEVILFKILLYMIKLGLVFDFRKTFLNYGFT